MNFEPPPTGQLPLPEFSLPFRPHRPPPRPVQASPSFSLPIRPRAAPRNPAHIEAEPISTTPAHAAVATESNSKDPTQWLQYGGLWHQVGSFAVATSIADPTLPVTPQVEEDVLRAVVRSAERRAVAQALKPQPQPPQTQAEKKRNRWKGSKSFVPRPMGQELVNFTRTYKLRFRTVNPDYKEPEQPQQPTRLTRRERKAERRRQAEAEGKEGMSAPDYVASIHRRNRKRGGKIQYLDSAPNESNAQIGRRKEEARLRDGRNKTAEK